VDQYLVYHTANYLDQSRDLSFDTEYEDKVKKLSVDQVNAALRKYISLDKMTLIYAGDFK
jgi:zinc protease